MVRIVARRMGRRPEMPNDARANGIPTVSFIVAILRQGTVTVLRWLLDARLKQFVSISLRSAKLGWRT
jgi:hypothetical protein